MEVNKISATIRYSQDTGKGSWKVVGLGAEASISDREFWQQAQSELYYQSQIFRRPLVVSCTGALARASPAHRGRNASQQRGQTH